MLFQPCKNASIQACASGGLFPGQARSLQVQQWSFAWRTPAGGCVLPVGGVVVVWLLLGLLLELVSSVGCQ